jgi:hypothetical protein
MRMQSLIFLGIKIGLCCLIFSIDLQAQIRTKSVLDRHVVIDSSFNANIWSAVHILADQGVPIGFEAAENWNVDMGPRLSLKSGRLVDVLNSISGQDKSYSWQEADGVIDFTPSSDRNKEAILFLDMSVDPLLFGKGDNRAFVVQTLQNLSEKGKVKDFRFLSALGSDNDLGLPDGLDAQLYIPASSMKTVLNKLIKVQVYSPIWSIVRYSNEKELTLFF